MSTSIERLRDRIDALSLRERGLLLAIFLLLLWALWEMLLMGPVSERQDALAQRLESARGQLAAYNTSIQQLAAEQRRDPLAEMRARLELLQRQRAELDARLAQATSGLIEPRDMGALLEQLLARHAGVEMRALRSLSPEPLADGDTAALPPVYRHGIEVEVAGRYLDLLAFVQQLEQLPWQFLWEELALEVEDAPRSRLRLRLYTLGLREGWMGV